MVLKTECCENCLHCWEEIGLPHDWCSLHSCPTYPDECCYNHDYYLPLSAMGKSREMKNEKQEFIRRIIKWS